MTASVSDPSRHLALALDVASIDEARALAREASESVGVLKVGLELFLRFGADATRIAGDLDKELFLDLKLHDIPETVERSIEGVASLAPRYLTVHAGGGAEMLRRSARVAASLSSPLTILAVTVLTSLDRTDLDAMGFDGSVEEHALGLAKLAWNAGIRGFVTSPSEVSAMRKTFPEALLVTPGVRPAGRETHDQKRVATPTQAIANGADLLVIGRPIRDADDRSAAARAIHDEMGVALQARASSKDH